MAQAVANKEKRDTAGSRKDLNIRGRRKETQKMDVYQMCLQDTVRRNQLVYCTSLKQFDHL